MIVIRYKMYIVYSIVVAILLIPLFAFSVGIYDLIKEGEFSLPAEIILIALSFFILALVLKFSFFPNFKVILDENGLTKINKISIGSLNLVNKKYLFTWNEISSFDYWGWGFVWGFVAIARKNNNKFLAAVYNGILTNKNEAIRYTVEHLPSYKIGTDAKKYLRKKMPDIKL